MSAACGGTTGGVPELGAMKPWSCCEAAGAPSRAGAGALAFPRCSARRCLITRAAFPGEQPETDPPPSRGIAGWSAREGNKWNYWDQGREMNPKLEHTWWWFDFPQKNSSQ